MTVEATREWNCQSYIADALGAITTRLFRYTGADKFYFPLFTESLEEYKKEETKSEKTADEIFDGIIAHLDVIIEKKGGKQ